MRECPPAFVQILAPLGADERGLTARTNNETPPSAVTVPPRQATGTSRLRFLEEGFAAIGIESISTRMSGNTKQ